MYDYIWSTESLVASSLRFTRECNDTVQMTLQDWAVGTSDSTSHKESQMKEPTLEENRFYKEHYEIPTGKGDRIRIMGDLPLTVVGSEVGGGDSDFGPKTRKCNTQSTDRVKFLNKSKDTQDSCCLGLEDNSLSKHFGFKIRIPDWIEPHYIPGSRQSQKKPVHVTRDVMDDCTKPDEPPDFTTETLWDSPPKYVCIWSTKSLVARNLRFTRECHDTVHMTLQD